MTETFLFLATEAVCGGLSSGSQNHSQNNWLNCTDEHADALSDLSAELKDTLSKFKTSLPQVDGLLLRPHLRKRAKLSLQTKKSLGAKSLPQPPMQNEEGRDKIMATETELDRGHSICER